MLYEKIHVGVGDFEHMNMRTYLGTYWKTNINIPAYERFFSSYINTKHYIFLAQNPSLPIPDSEFGNPIIPTTFNINFGCSTNLYRI